MKINEIHTGNFNVPDPLREPDEEGINGVRDLQRRRKKDLIRKKRGPKIPTLKDLDPQHSDFSRMMGRGMLPTIALDIDEHMKFIEEIKNLLEG